MGVASPTGADGKRNAGFARCQQGEIECKAWLLPVEGRVNVKFTPFSAPQRLLRCLFNQASMKSGSNSLGTSSGSIPGTYLIPPLIPPDQRLPPSSLRGSRLGSFFLWYPKTPHAIAAKKTSRVHRRLVSSSLGYPVIDPLSPGSLEINRRLFLFLQGLFRSRGEDTLVRCLVT